MHNWTLARFVVCLKCACYHDNNWGHSKLVKLCGKDAWQTLGKENDSTLCTQSVIHYDVQWWSMSWLDHCVLSTLQKVACEHISYGCNAPRNTVLWRRRQQASKYGCERKIQNKTNKKNHPWKCLWERKCMYSYNVWITFNVNISVVCLKCT